MIQVACPHCKSVFTTAPGSAGREVTCPRCSGRLGVPSTTSLNLGVSVLCPHCRKVFSSAVGRPGDTITCNHCSKPVEIPGGVAPQSGSAAKVFVWLIVLLMAGSAGAIWFAMREKEPTVADAPSKAGKETEAPVPVTETKEPKSAEPPSAFVTRMKEADAALLQGNVEQARGYFQAAYDLNPQDRTTQEMLKTLQDYQAARIHLSKAGDALRAGNMTLLVGEIQKAGDFLGADFRRAVESRKPLQALLDKSGSDIEKLLSDALARLQTPGKSHKDRADEAWRRLNYTTAAEEYARAAAEAAKAKNLFPAFRALAPDRLRDDLDQKEQEASNQFSMLDRAAKKSEGHIHLEKGRNLLTKGKVAMVNAELDSRVVFEAQKAFAAALKELQEAARFPDTDAKAHLESVTKELARADRFVQPVAFNIAKQHIPADWTYSKKQWTFLKKNERVWLQASETPEATLASPTLAIPSSFELELTLAMIDRNSEIHNDYWGATRDALTLVLGSKTGNNLVITLGKDPAVIAQSHARLAVNKRTVDAQHLTAVKEPFTLTLRKHKESAAISLGAKQDVIVLPLSDDFNQFKLTLRNGFNKTTNQYFAFPIVLNASLKMFLEGEDAKAK